jgi:ribosome biogenesis GTPase / thiamine phosphate phosphatase
MKGIVTKSTGSNYVVKTENGERVNCKLKGKIRLDGRKSTNPAAVGDDVEIENNNGEFMITEIKSRKNYIIRKSINLSKQVQIIAANMDQAFLICTLVAPRTSLGFIDRFLITAEAYSIPVTIVFNKCDLLDEEALKAQQQIIEIYQTIGYTCLQVSSFNKRDIELLKENLAHKITLISGHSGVGKSTLINAIEPNLNLRTGQISAAHLKGMHTTTFAELFELSFGGQIIDTPGIKELGLVEMTREEIGHYFPEIRERMQNCKFNNCIHENEPHCAITEAVRNNDISAERYNSYLGILNGEEMDWKPWEI